MTTKKKTEETTFGQANIDRLTENVRIAFTRLGRPVERITERQMLYELVCLFEHPAAQDAVYRWIFLVPGKQDFSSGSLKFYRSGEMVIQSPDLVGKF